MTRSARTPFVGCIATACLVLLPQFAPVLPAATLAERILATTEVRGGLIVHLGCGDGTLTSALRTSDAYLVHGLDDDAENVQLARRNIAALGQYGPVSVELFDGKQLPFVDNLANLVVAEQLGDVSTEEVMRVLAPLGVAYLKQDGKWTKTVKPWPEAIDEWTHYLHGPDNNAVAADTVVAPPTGLQWVGGPLWSRAHSTLNGTSCMASAQGRIFTIEDLAPIEMPLLPGKYTLVARDAFNGVVLWRRPLENWENITHWMKPTPVQLPTRLVAVGDRVYATLGIFAPVTALDAATGQIVKVYEGTETTQEIVCSDGVLYLATGDPMNPYGLTAKQPGYRPQFAVFGEENYSPMRPPKDNPQVSILAIGTKSGRQLWKLSGADTDEYQATTLAVRGDMLVYQTKTDLVRIDRASGKTVWKRPFPIRMEGDFKIGGSSPTLVLTDDVILRADAKDLVAFSADNGNELWRTDTTTTYFSSPDVFVVDDVVWPYPSTKGHDIRTGRVVATRRTTRDGPMGHDRCYRNKATVNYMINSRSGGADFSKFGDDWSLAHPWIRGTCSLGIMPCNGLLYASPHACSCANEAKLNGFYALSATAHDDRRENLLEKGPAFNNASGRAARATAQEWSTYRRDAARSANARVSLPADIRPLWKATIPNPTAPVVAAGKLLIADKLAHTVHCLDSEDGKAVWTFTAGGRIDSPPTYTAGLVLFGAADGWVYCLSAESGELAWKFRAAPQARNTVAFGQVESLWPVHGSLLVLDDTAYFAAGRQSFLNGGISLYGLDVTSGKKKYETRIDGPYGEDGESIFDLPPGADESNVRVQSQVKGNLSDILLSDGELIYLRHMAFHLDLSPAEKAKDHLMTVSGFLDGAGHHRSYWTIAEHLIYDTNIGKNIDADLLVVDGPKVFGTRIRSSNRGPSEFDPSERGFTLFAMKRTEKTAAKQPARRPPAKNAKATRGGGTPNYTPAWDAGVPVNGKAMLKAGDLLFLCGTPNDFPRHDLFRAVTGKMGGVLVAASVEDGRTVSQYRLSSPPVWDGMAAANDRLFIAFADGHVECWGPK